MKGPRLAGTQKIYLNVACAGMDVHYKFSNVTFSDRSEAEC